MILLVERNPLLTSLSEQARRHEPHTTHNKGKAKRKERLQGDAEDTTVGRAASPLNLRFVWHLSEWNCLCKQCHASLMSLRLSCDLTHVAPTASTRARVGIGFGIGLGLGCVSIGVGVGVGVEAAAEAIYAFDEEIVMTPRGGGRRPVAGTRVPRSEMAGRIVGCARRAPMGNREGHRGGGVNVPGRRHCAANWRKEEGGGEGIPSGR